MKKGLSNRLRRRFHVALGGAVLVALCCFTPLLVVSLGALGLSLLVPYLDILLLPALMALLILVFVSYLQWRKAR